MGKYCVYKHTAPSGKVYIGITKQKPNKRWRNGVGYRNNPHFWRAIRSYGWGNIKHEILFENLTEEDACEKEKQLIAEYNSTDCRFGYNCRSGGEKGASISDETKKRMSESMKKYYAEHPESIEELRKRVTGFHHTEETKKKMSEAFKKKPYMGRNEEWRKHIGESNKARMKSDKNLYEANATRLREMEKEKQRAVLQLDVNGELLNAYESAHDAQRKTGIRNGNISKCCNGKAKTAGGFKWQYAV